MARLEPGGSHGERDRFAWASTRDVIRVLPRLDDTSFRAARRSERRDENEQGRRTDETKDRCAASSQYRSEQVDVEQQSEEAQGDKRGNGNDHDSLSVAASETEPQKHCATEAQEG